MLWVSLFWLFIKNLPQHTVIVMFGIGLEVHTLQFSWTFVPRKFHGLFENKKLGWIKLCIPTEGILYLWYHACYALNKLPKLLTSVNQPPHIWLGGHSHMTSDVLGYFWPTYPNQTIYYISLFSKIRCSLTYLPT